MSVDDLGDQTLDQLGGGVTPVIERPVLIRAVERDGRILLRHDKPGVTYSLIPGRIAGSLVWVDELTYDQRRALVDLGVLERV